MKTNIHFLSYFPQFAQFLDWKMFQIVGVEKLETHVLFSITFFENRAVYEIIWKRIVQQGRPQMTIWRMRIACWIPKFTNTPSESVILIAFPLQQWLSVTSWYIACHVSCIICRLYTDLWMLIYWGNIRYNRSGLKVYIAVSVPLKQLPCVNNLHSVSNFLNAIWWFSLLPSTFLLLLELGTHSHF